MTEVGEVSGGERGARAEVAVAGGTHGDGRGDVLRVLGRWHVWQRMLGVGVFSLPVSIVFGIGKYHLDDIDA